MSKLKKAITAILIIAVMCTTTGIQQMSTALAATSGDYEYTDNGDGTCTITGYTGAGGDITIPDTLGGLTVIEIGDRAFYDNAAITSVDMPDSVVTIADYAFGKCRQLSSITMSGKLQTIGYRAFEYVEKLKSISIPDSVSEIGERAFWLCSDLESITIPSGLTRIEDSTFYKCESLSSISLPEGLISIGQGAFSYCNMETMIIPESVTTIESGFSYCSRLKTMTIPKNVSAIVGRMFYCCDSLESITVDERNANYQSIDGVLYDKDVTQLIRYPAAKSNTHYVIPDGFTEIPDDAFRNCDLLQTISIPDSITRIGNQAFYYCDGMERIIIPENVNYIGEHAFSQMSNLKVAIILSNVVEICDYGFAYSGLKKMIIRDEEAVIGNKSLSGRVYWTNPSYTNNIEWGSDVVITDDNFVFDNATGKLLAYAGYEQNVTIPSIIAGVMVKEIGIGAFRSDSELESAEIQGGVTKVGEEAFANCSNLESVVLPDSIEVLHEGVFSGCKDLGSIILSENLTDIGDNAFYNCEDLSSIFIPSSVQRIGVSVFQYCSKLRSINVDSLNNDYKSIDGTLYNKSCTELICHPENIYVHNMVIPEGVTVIADSAFASSNYLTTVDFPIGLKTIGESAFQTCVLLTGIDIPDTVTEIGKAAFRDCYALINAELSNNLLRIEDLMFYNCNLLEEFDIPSNVTQIGSSVFSLCDKLSRVSIPNDVVSIGRNTFSKCRNLTEIILPDKLESLGQSAFSECSKLESIVIPNSVTEIGTFTFEKCSELKKVQFPTSLRTIGMFAFLYCGSLENIHIPYGTEVIDTGAFRSCTDLKKAVIPVTVTDFGEEYTMPYNYYHAFDECSDDLDLLGEYGSEVHYYANRAGIDYLATTMPDPETLQLEETTPQTGSSNVATGININLIFNNIISLGDDIYEKIQLFEVGSEKPIQIQIDIINGRKLKITPEINAMTKATHYYLLTTDNAIYKEYAPDVFFQGFLNPDDYSFSTVPNITSEPVYVDLIYPDGNAELPPIPKGSTQDYINEIYEWVKDYGLEDMITKEDIEAVIGQPVKLIIDEENGFGFFTEDGAGNVQELAMNIIFIQQMQYYLESLQEQLSTTKIYGLPQNKYKEEGYTLNRLLTYNDQINRYMEGLQAPMMLNVLAAVLIETAIEIDEYFIDEDSGYKIAYKYFRPFIKMGLKMACMDEDLKSLSTSNGYDDTLEAMSNIDSYIEGTKAAYQFSYWGDISDGGKEIIKDIALGSLMNSAKQNNNPVLKFVSDVYESYQGVNKYLSAFKNCVYMGTSLGFANYVIEFYQDSMEQITDSLKSWYFVSDYYISVHYPSIYNSVLGEDLITKEEFRTYAPLSGGFGFYLDAYGEPDASDAYLENIDIDPILKRWADYADHVVTRHLEDQIFGDGDEKDVYGVRKKIGDLAGMVTFLQSVDIIEVKLSLLKYISAETHNNIASVMVACPVVIKVYNRDDELVEVISSLSDVPVESVVGTFSLTGENNEIKVFAVDSSDYYIEIIPYDNGTMSIYILNNNNEVTSYTDIQLSVNEVYSTADLGGDTTLNVSDGQNTNIVESDSVISVNSINVFCNKNNIAVGETVQACVEILPSNTTNQNIIWSVSDEAIATIDNAGIVTAVSEGTVSVMARAEENIEVLDELTLDIYRPMTSLSVQQESYTMLDTEQIEFIVITGEGEEDLMNQIVWLSTDASIAYVDDNCKIIGVSEGIVTIVGEYYDKSVSIQVEVINDTTLDCDYNFDGVVDMLDLVLAAQKYSEKYDITEYVDKRDVNCDSIINLFDLMFIAKEI